MTKESNIGQVEATIANGVALSGAVELLDLTPVGFIMPAAWDAANLTFQVGDSDDNYADLYDDLGSEVVVNASTSRVLRLVPSEWVVGSKLKIRSGTTGTPVNQTAARTIIILTRNY